MNNSKPLDLALLFPLKAGLFPLRVGGTLSTKRQPVFEDKRAIVLKTQSLSCLATVSFHMGLRRANSDTTIFCTGGGSSSANDNLFSTRNTFLRELSEFKEHPRYALVRALKKRNRMVGHSLSLNVDHVTQLGKPN